MNWETPENKGLIEAILALETADEARRFLRDLMTEKEIEEFANRLETAILLSEKVSYTNIKAKTGLSSTTIARVSKWLNGSEGGYRAILQKLHHANSIPSGSGLS